MKAVSLFYSYSHRDEDLRVRLQDHLAVLRRAGHITEWHDRDIDVGEDWAKAIDENLATADIILLLVSASFLASDYCWGNEMTTALDRHQRGEATVVPVILRPCRWQTSPLAKLQAAPRDGRPVTQWPDMDAAFDDVAEKIERVVATLREVEGPTSDDAGSATVSSALNAQSIRERPHRTPPVARMRPKRSPDTESAEAPKVDIGTGPPPLADLAVFKDVDEPWCPEMVEIPPGEFWMGSAEDDDLAFNYEKPRHRVTIKYRFALGRCPVTFDEYDAFCDATGRDRPDDRGWGRGRRPAINVSWEDAQAYAAWLSGQTGKTYRLPSEAEWEYACRAWTATRYFFGGDEAALSEHAWFGGNSGGMTHPVGGKAPNNFGLHDMHGNVWEWVEDTWHDSYRGAPDDGTAWTGGDTDSARVVRGGSWVIDPWGCRSAFRDYGGPGNRGSLLGFRLARTL